MVLDFTKVMYNLIKIYVGIDISTPNHFAAAISSDSEIIIEPFKFTNDTDSFHAYGSSGISSQIELTRTHYQRSVQRIKHLISIYTNNTTIYPFVYYYL